jgi:hypothetical protein
MKKLKVNSRAKHERRSIDDLNDDALVRAEALRWESVAPSQEISDV